jgi:arsenate reductase
MEKQRVLFVCIHNSARSQMAEEILRQLAGDRFEVESAGLEPGTLNPFVVRALAESGIDIAGKQTRAVFDLFKAGKIFHYVIAVCDAEAAERCPIFPGTVARLHWSFADPSRFTGSDEERLAATRAVRDEIRSRIEAWLAGLDTGA